VQQTARIFDHLVGADDEGRRRVEAKRPGGLEVDHKLVLGRGLHGQIGRLLALQNAASVDAAQTKRVP
jgi:hypothetical protein